MTKLTNSADGGALPAEGRPSDPLAQRDAFERLYVKWLRARAAESDPDADSSDEAGARRIRDTCEAARQLLIAHTPIRWMVWLKWEVLESDVAEERRGGQAADDRVGLALACIKADLMRFGACDMFGE